MRARLRHIALADARAADAALAALRPSPKERRFQKLDGSRAGLFAELNAPALAASTARRWQWTMFKRVAAHKEWTPERLVHWGRDIHMNITARSPSCRNAFATPSEATATCRGRLARWRLNSARVTYW